MRKQAINSSSLRIAVRKNYSLLLVKISLFAFASVAIVAKLKPLSRPDEAVRQEHIEQIKRKK